MCRVTGADGVVKKDSATECRRGILVMAVQERREMYAHAIIDCSDMTLTEYQKDDAKTYGIVEILKRWDGVPDIEIEIRQRSTLPTDKR